MAQPVKNNPPNDCKMIAIETEWFASGYCTAHANVVDPVNGKGKTRFYAVWGLLKVPNQGYILFDTGYSPRFNSVTSGFPEKLYRWATPIQLEKGQSAVEILATKGITAGDIKYIVLSHLHADHVAGMLDFPDAQFICSKAMIDEFQALNGFKAVKKGLIKKLFPNNFLERIVILENAGNKTQLGALNAYMLFDSFYLIEIPGHAKGMLGLVAHTEHEKIIFASDAAWSKFTFDKGILPNKIVKLFFDSWSDFVSTQEKLRFFLEENTDYKIYFTHCPETLKITQNV